MRWIWQGGAGINWAEQQVGRCAGFRLVVLMIGGNDLDAGWCSPYQLADRIGFLAHQILQEGAETVVIPSLWPRSNVNYNTRARQYAGIMERRFSFDPQVTFWLWDRRQAWRNVDGVHFLHRYTLPHCLYCVGYQPQPLVKTDRLKPATFARCEYGQRTGDVNMDTWPFH